MSVSSQYIVCFSRLFWELRVSFNVVRLLLFKQNRERQRERKEQEMFKFVESNN